MKQDKLEPVTNPEWGQTPFREVDVDRYISPEHVRLEAERLWPYAWQMACREEEIQNPGDYFEFEIGDQSILITRTPSGEIKAYFNACLHRGTQLAKGCGNVTNFTCPFHGWTWSLDGENRHVLDIADFPGLKSEDLKLPQAEVGTWGGFVFVKLTEGGPSLEEYLPPVPEHLAPYNVEEFRIRFWRTTIIKSNWKAALEAFEETYHTLKTHPQIMKGMDDVGVVYETMGAHSRMIVTNAVPSARYRGNVKEQEVLKVSIAGLLDFGLADEAERTALEAMANTPLEEGQTTRDIFRAMSYDRLSPFMPDLPVDQFLKVYHYTIFPNFAFNLMPGTMLGLHARPNGDDPDSCIFDVICLQHPAGEDMPTAKREVITDPDFDWGVVFAQDASNLERIQKGMHARTMKKTRLASYQEMRIANRFDIIDEYYREHAEDS